YGVLDIRAWQMLYSVRGVDANPAGRGFTVAQWLRYLETLRCHARRLRSSARAVEYTLFLCHRNRQRGLLYDPRQRPRRGAMAPASRGSCRCSPGPGLPAWAAVAPLTSTTRW